MRLKLAPSTHQALNVLLACNCQRKYTYVVFGISTADVSPLGGLFHIAAQTMLIPGKAEHIELVLSISTILEENISED